MVNTKAQHMKTERRMDEETRTAGFCSTVVELSEMGVELRHNHLTINSTFKFSPFLRHTSSAETGLRNLVGCRKTAFICE